MSIPPALLKLLPRPLRCAALLARLQALDDEYRASGGRGSYGFEVHYRDGDPRLLRIVGPSIEVDVGPGSDIRLEE